MYDGKNDAALRRQLLLLVVVFGFGAKIFLLYPKTILLTYLVLPRFRHSQKGLKIVPAQQKNDTKSMTTISNKTTNCEVIIRSFIRYKTTNNEIHVTLWQKKRFIAKTQKYPSSIILDIERYCSLMMHESIIHRCETNTNNLLIIET